MTPTEQALIVAVDALSNAITEAARLHPGNVAHNSRRLVRNAQAAIDKALPEYRAALGTRDR